MNNKKILIIGGTGALGKTLIRIYQDTNIIRVFSRDEHKQVSLATSNWVNKKVTYVIGDVKDKDSIINVIEDFQPHVVINTAALKHVPICEINPFESVKVNIIGHQNLIEAVQRARHQIETLIFISSDKACKPINTYGMCKAISERLYIEFAKKQTAIRVCLVRYGNVLESTGSVIPLFKMMLDRGDKFLPITDPRMTRFLLTLEQAAGLIDWAYYCAWSHGKIAVPKVNSFLITDIAKALIKNKHGDENAVELKMVGVRPGEKIHEEMVSAEEWMRTYTHTNGTTGAEFENFLISDEVVRSEAKSYNSLDAAMDGSQVYDFLKQCKVI
jgi:FlaA1/EpsC-like NDP-sugar epimerase